MQIIDSPRAASVQMRDPRAALISGELQTDNVLALQSFQEAFSFSPEAVERARKHYEADTGIASVHVSKSTPFVFKYLLSESFIGGSAKGETINFYIVGEGEFTVRFDDGSLEVIEGRSGRDGARVVMSRNTFGGIIFFSIRAASAAAVAQKQRVSQGVGVELSDVQLALVAGGKGSDGSCFSDYCGGDILVCGGDMTVCGGDGGVSCPNDYCGGDACFSDNCGADVCAADACYSDTGPIGTCTADGCAAAVCGGDACGVAACPGDACAEAACFQDLCGGDACGADFCGGDACGAAACGADLCPIDACLADFCFVNLIPVVPIV